MTTRTTPNNLPEMWQSCIDQHNHLDSAEWGYGATWESDCQAFVHCMWGLRIGGFSSAFNQWLGLDPEDRIVLTDLDKAPLGSTLFTKGASPYGHTFPTARDFKTGVAAGWSTDLPKTGYVGKIARTTPLKVWGHRPLGAGLSVNGYALDLSGLKPPRPKQNKKYQRIQRAIDNIGDSVDALVIARRNLHRALETAHARTDKRDAERIARHIRIMNGDIQDARAEIERLQNLYSHIRHS